MRGKVRKSPPAEVPAVRGDEKYRKLFAIFPIRLPLGGPYSKTHQTRWMESCWVIDFCNTGDFAHRSARWISYWPTEEQENKIEQQQQEEK